YYLSDGDKVITEQRGGKDRKHSLSGKFTYELNQKTAFINNTLMTELCWDNIDLSTTGTLPNTQSASLPDYYVSNNFKLIKRFGGKHLVTFNSVNEWESLPQTMAMNTAGNSFTQQVRDHAFVTNESAAYTFALGGFTVGLEGGIKGYFRTMKSDLTGLSDPSDRSDLSDQLHNVVNTNYLTLYVTPKFEYWIKRLNFEFTIPLSFAHYSFDKELANRNEFYFSPSLSANWKPNNIFSMTLRGGLGRSPMSLNMIQPGLIMTDYRSFRSGVDNFYSSSSKNVGASLYYKQPRNGLFANASLSQAWGRLPYTMVQQLLGDYIVYSYSDAKSDNDMFRASGSFGKSLDFMRGTVKLNGSFTRNKSNLISENQDVNSTGTSWSAGLSLNGAPTRWLSFDYRINYSSTSLKMNGVKTPWLSGIQNEFSIGIIPHKKWEWTISGEHYRNELEKDIYKNIFLVDTKLTFNLNKRLEFSAALS
ncbi:MAG: hypothetical protein K2M10_00165, partial [Muribaculaceae bacterium]|nr:hypothetical protein [Muribaculaceae bacterium]